MAFHGMSLRSGRVVGLGPPPPPLPPPAPIPAGPLPPGLPALNTLIGLPQQLREQILEALFQGQPRMDLEYLFRPQDLASLCLVNHQLKVEATEAFFRVSSFEVTILTAMQDIPLLHDLIEWGQVNPDPGRVWTLAQFRRLVARARPLVPAHASPSWGRVATYRMMRSAGEFPWNTCQQWVKDAGPFIRDIDFNVLAPIYGHPPLVSQARSWQLMWDTLLVAQYSVQAVPGPGADLMFSTLDPTYPPGPRQPGMIVPGGVPPVWQDIEYDSFDGYCERANFEAIRIRQSYVPAVIAPGARGFTGFTLWDLRSIAKSFSEPSFYVIQD